jgi:hypothetical protein
MTTASIIGISDALQQFTADCTSTHHVATSYFVTSMDFWVVMLCNLVEVHQFFRRTLMDFTKLQGATT